MKKHLSIFLLLSILLTAVAPKLFAGIPIVDAPVQQENELVIAKKSVKRAAKWKQKLASKIIAKKADIGENRTAAIIFSVLIPPVGVAIFQDGITKDFWMTCLLTLFLIVPGIIYALSIVLKRY